MCLSPVKLRTSSLYRSIHYSKYYVDVPCGNCAECQQQKKNDWYLRNYFESTVTWRDGGYTLFDTLTFDDLHLPMISKLLLGVSSNVPFTQYLDAISNFCKVNNISLKTEKVISLLRSNDFPCFDYHDIQNFFKLLRIRLERAGFPVKGNLRYFLASEYGHDELYKDSSGRQRRGTCRPHYHVLFYVNGCLKRAGLTPEVLSLFISTCWKNGRTDGVPYRDSVYVINHNTFGPSYIMEPDRLRGVQYYVSKYVCKDYEFQDTVDKRISFLLTQLYKVQYDSPRYREYKRILHRVMDQFHRQSEGFGLLGFLIDDVNWKSVQSDFKVKLPDKKDGVKSFSVPQYYVRKIFQECVKDAEGNLHWVWNNLGKSWQSRRIKNNVDLLSTKMKDWYENMSVYTPLHVSFVPKVSKLLNGRSWKDYAEYVIYYKGRFCSTPKNLDTPDNIISSSLESPYSLESDQVFKRLDNGNYVNLGKEYTSSELESQYVISDKSDLRFKDFDTIYNIYCISMDSYNIKKQVKYENDKKTSKILKSYGLHPKK